MKFIKANNIIVSSDPTLAGLFGDAFDAAFDGDVKAAVFRKNPIAADYKPISDRDTPNIPEASIAFSLTH